MDKNNSSPGGGSGETAVDGGDWRSRLKPETRQKMVGSIMEILKMHRPPEGLIELERVAARSEEQMFNISTSQLDYLVKITQQRIVLGMNTKYQNNPSSSSGSVITKKRKRQNEGYHKASEEDLKALTTIVDLVEERHIKLREAIVEKWMLSETGKVSQAEAKNISYLKGFEHAYRAKASFGEDYLLKKDHLALLESLPRVDCFGPDLDLPEGLW